MHCRVWIEEQRRWLDIEPTLRNEPSDESPGAVTGRELTDVQLVAKLYYNRAIESLGRREFEPALEAAHHSCRLDDRHVAARDNLIAVINNWALQLATQQRYEEALMLIATGLRDCPHSDLLATNEVHVYVKWMQGLLARGDLAGVQARLQTALARYPDSAVLWSIQSALGSHPQNH
jgi:tetratricopeptide (TPR) repeat protein